MILEERTYTLHPGKVGEYFSLYEKEGMAIQVPILGRLVGYFSTEIGELNQVVHMWAYDSLEERTRRRAELMADPRWKAFVPKLLALVQKMETRILVPAPFSPLK
ncbi:MAG TPA: NIPSNAP family protein [Thermodesulfobacteriota bacterium]